MFTGIVEDVGTVVRVNHSAVTVATDLPGIKKGESVAVNGVCLTVTHTGLTEKGAKLEFDYSPETAHRTNIGELVAGSRVNLERALRAGDRFGGHLMTGHVEGKGQMMRKERQGGSWKFTFAVDRRVVRYVVMKGSVGVDGISLTVVDCGLGWFTVSIIPFTMEHSNIGLKRPGETVNIEPDILAKYIEQMINGKTPGTNITEEFLKEHGFGK